VTEESPNRRRERFRWAERVRRPLLLRTRLVMVGVGLAAAVLVLSPALLDEGEIVVLTVIDDAGRERDTDLWVVDLDGVSYLRAARPDARWLSWMIARPDVVLTRAGSKRALRAIPDDRRETFERVRRAMAVKYGLADRLWGIVADRSHGRVIRLEPRGADERP